MKQATGKVESKQLEKHLATETCFIETQFPVAKVSTESYKERKANYSQTLTGLGKWWGRKPLVVVRAAILGLLMPASDNPEKDKEIFLKLMTMDDEGLWLRKNKSIPQGRLLEVLLQMPPSVRQRYLDPASEIPKLRVLIRNEREELQRLVFYHIPYSEKLSYCCRPEQIDGPSLEAWKEINAHLGTKATSLPELVEELGKICFGHRPRVGDSFCGAGSVPFEAARLGCDAYGSDLSPVAALLTWATLNIVGGGVETFREVQQAQQEVFDAVDLQVTEWGIEHNEKGWRADAYLYCVEVRDPESGWMIPLAPSWVIGEKTHTIAKLMPDPDRRFYKIEIHEGVTDDEMMGAEETGTVKNTRLIPPNEGPSTPIEVIRRNLRMWENEDLVPRPDDVFQERLYCIRWVETYYEKRVGKKTIELNEEQAETLPNYKELIKSGELKEKTRRHYRAPTEEDLNREQKALGLLKQRFHEWQGKGYIPSRRIEPGAKTDEPIRTRGWTHWHHLFTPRQLLINGLFLEYSIKQKFNSIKKISSFLGLGRITNWNSKLCVWDPSSANEKGSHTFLNQALNTLYYYAGRSLISLSSAWFLRFPVIETYGEFIAEPKDAKVITNISDIWITDPPYADAINYHELSEFFLAWYEKHLTKLFPDWYTDSKRALAVKGNDENFRKSMVDCYKRLVNHMPDNGLQIVMFTHQDASVWADLTMILWAAGLRVTGAWCIATETDSALKKGNYVQGTVLMVCRKRTEEEPVFLDETAHRVEMEVKRQIDQMVSLEDESDPNFADADYQLAAYAAAIRVLTEKPIEEINPEREILKTRERNEINPVEQLIRNAVKIACDYLVPRGIEREIWKTLTSMERFYLKGLEIESHGEYRSGVYQELARGFGATDYPDLIASTKANQTRLKTATEFSKRILSDDGFGKSLVRQLLFAIHRIMKNDSVQEGLNWLRTEIPDYWGSREKIVRILEYVNSLGRVSYMNHWCKDAEAAALLAGAVRNDHV